MNIHIPDGRALLAEELHTFCQAGWEQAMHSLIREGKARVLPGVCLQEKRCNRCGQQNLIWADCASCCKPCAYCSLCLQMGRSKACTPLYYIGNYVEPMSLLSAPRLKWTGQLTPAQQEASDQAVNLLHQTGKELLIWAVCGAGKTEVTFQPIEEAFQRKQRVLFVTPRKDVVLELLPRLSKAFPEAKIIALHGKSKEKWEEAHLTLSTTHQAIRFYEKFDFIIIDEVDAFPYHNNPMLYYAVNRAKKLHANLLYLSATPPEYLQKKPHVRIPARFHRQPLAIPQLVIDGSLSKILQADQAYSSFQQILHFLQLHQRQAFFFVPYIEGVEKLVSHLSHNYPISIRMEGTHSRDPEREEKVKRFRQGDTRILVTTTIMERGVTVPKADVIVVGADAPIFDEASLVQIAGRAGRSIEDPIGHVIFFACEKTREMKKAVKHIQEMNKIAKKKGLLDG
ncbi:DEAD/DEAH box helicase [Ammoniphilus sp. CFH 90114]|uniref:DEAD/DEAH box helicase n=1 Tax=Ammoniphilus sp. CFH 90114 TaxID=2493665 RepID=UPI00100EFA5F|nr:DEAD/DEAH box helicase family protein [Ammoniphilus sp. CFH 90114]RXT04489.1 DEAD/DEAH box helicase [Ammoniphilus sp. CFH 90114]